MGRLERLGMSDREADGGTEPVVTIAAALASDVAEEREEARCGIERAVAERDVACVVACVKPLFEAVLCAPAIKVGEAEYARSSLLLHEMQKLDALKVCSEMWRNNRRGSPLFAAAWSAPGTVLAEMTAKEPKDFDRSDAIIAALSQSNIGFQVANTVGLGACCDAAGIDVSKLLDVWAGQSPFTSERALRVVSLAKHCLELVRSEADTQPEAVIAGAWRILCDTTTNSAAASQVFEAGFADVAGASLQRWNAVQRISRHNSVPSAVLTALTDVSTSAAKAGAEIMQPLLDAGVVDIIISTLTAYQLLGPEQSSVVAVQYGALELLKTLLRFPEHSKSIIAKLQTAGYDSFRFILDNPLVVFPVLLESGATATRIAAAVRPSVPAWTVG